MKIWWVPVLFLLLPVQGLWAQRCIAQERLEQHLLSFPASLPARAAIEQFALQYAESAPIAVQSRTVVTIPVVFHVVWRLPEENITDEQIQSQMVALNKDFRRLNNVAGLIPAFFQSFAADMEINFCLAQRNPGGLPANGIVRISSSIPYIGDRIANGRKSICYTADGGSNAWDPSRYINIWVGRRQFFPAEASFPGAAPATEDGIIIDPSFVGTTGTAAQNQPYHLGHTLTHEMGHFFNLYHLWGPGQPGSCTQSDEVADTPLQSKTYLSECPTHPQITCGTADMFMNFMNYTDDACMAMFTLGQKTRALATLNGFRAGLLSSDGCQQAVSIAETEVIRSIRVVGNPVIERIWLKMHGLNGVLLEWRLVAHTGRQERQGRIEGAEDALISVAGLPAGVYVLQVFNEAVQFAEKIIIL